MSLSHYRGFNYMNNILHKSRKKFIIICMGMLLIYIFFLLWNVYKSNHNEYISSRDLEAYCIKNTTCGAKSFYIKNIDNYYFCVSKDGDTNKSADFFVFNRNHNSDEKLTFFGGLLNTAGTKSSNYLTYLSPLPDKKGNVIGNSMIYVSQNDSKIVKAIITIKVNNEYKDESFSLNPNSPFILKIDNLGIIDGKNKAITEYHFYNQQGIEVPEI